MINKKHLLVICLLSMTGIPVLFAQTGNECKVLMEKISGEYKGKCENGLANGKGTAKGEDTYIGNFKDGLPDGKGKYIYSNGNIYDGNWSNGLKDGKGQFDFKVNGVAQTLKGYWQNGEYAGLTDPGVGYRVSGSSGIVRNVVEKKAGPRDVISFAIVSAFVEYVPQDLRIVNSSGQIMQNFKKFEISNHTYPLHCEISYSVRMSGGLKLCRFLIDFTAKGSYEVTLYND